MADIAAHREPVLRAEANFLIHVDLEPFGMSNRMEQLWVRRQEDGSFVVCCLPFFSYGIALRDVVAARRGDLVFEKVLQKSGHRLLRFAFSDERVAGTLHEQLHGRLVQANVVHEWHGSGYGAIDLAGPADEPKVMGILAPMIEDGTLTVEVD